MPYRRLGSTDRLSTTVKDITGTYADPGDIFLKIRDPAGAVTTNDYNPGPIVRDDVGKFHFDVANLTMLGKYASLWKTTGTSQGVQPNPRYWTLVDEWTPILLTFDEAKSQVNATTPDADLELYVDSVTEMMEKWVGPIIPRVVTRTAIIGSDGRLLFPTAVVPGSFTAATQNGASVSISGWTTDDSDFVTTGLLRLYGTVTGTYTAGFDPIPAPLKESAALFVQHSLESQRGPAELPLAEAALGGGSTYPLLLDAQRLMGPYTRSMVA